MIIESKDKIRFEKIQKIQLSWFINNLKEISGKL